MLFNSYEYIFVFLPIVLTIYFFLLSKSRGTEIPKSWLILASLVFYGWWNIGYLLLLLSSVILNYLLCQIILRRDKNDHYARKSVFIFGICLNVGLLLFFKYTNFFITNINHLTNHQMELLYIALPVGISFFSFTQIACLAQAYNEPDSNFSFLDYSLFVVFFPYLFSGPIAYHREIIPQFEKDENRVLDNKNIATGIYLFSIGLFKKVVVGDSLAEWVNNGFDANTLTLIEAWLTSLSYTLQLYFDFSGYTDMALGSALFFNVKLPINFNSPYKSLNIQDFWRRWHITLGRFLRDHVYIPMGGGQSSIGQTIRNILITFLICGLWHGAGWTFIAWGLLHGFGMVIYRLWRKLNIDMPKALACFITFNFINIAWVFFRAKDFNDAAKVLKGMLGMTGIVLPGFLGTKLGFLRSYNVEFGVIMSNIRGTYVTIPVVLFLISVSLWFSNSNEMMAKFKPTVLHILFIGSILVLAILHLSINSEFLYFRF
jgi:alginate O-acetyltransferase complex protein AlgI